MAKQSDASDLIQRWMDTQQSLWKGWVDTLQKGSGASMGENWTLGLERWQEAVNRSLEVQHEAMQTWAAQVDSIEGAPDEAKKWARDGVQLIEQWNDAQRGLWEQWFALMRNATPSSGEGFGAAQAQQFMQSWEQTAKRMQELQRQWVATMGAAGKPAGKPKTTKKKPTAE